MYKFAFALILMAVVHPAALGNGLDSDDSVKADNDVLKLYAAARPIPLRRTARVATPAPKRGRRERVLLGDAAAPKTVSRTHKATLKEEVRPAAKLSTREAAGGKGRRGRARMSKPFPSGLKLPIVQGGVRRGQEHYDPTGRGGPLLDTSDKYRREALSENFTVGELSQSGGKHSGISRIEHRLVVCLQAIRDHVNQPVWVRSAYRSYWRNLAVYKEMGKRPTDSQHIAGKASDIKVEGMTGLELAKVAVTACGPNVAVGIGIEFAHIDVRGTFGAWAYNGVPDRQLTELRQYREASLLAWKVRERRQRSSASLKPLVSRSQQTLDGASNTVRSRSSGRR